MSQGCAKQSEENDGLEQQLKDAQYTRTGDAMCALMLGIMILMSEPIESFDFPESENKYEALARKLQTQESEGQKSEERAENVQVNENDLDVDGLDIKDRLDVKNGVFFIMLF